MKTFAVIGLGRFGSAVAMQLFNMGYEVLAVDKEMENVNLVADYVTSAVCGDAKEEGVLKSIGIRNYDCAIVSIGNDLADSVLITLTLKEMGIGKIICKARDRQHEKILKKIGADTVIIPEHEAGIKTAVSLVSDHIIDIIDISDEYSIADRAIPESWIGKSIGELAIRKKFGINIVAIKNNSKKHEIDISPSADYIFKDTDIIVIAGKTTDINMLK